MNDIWEQQHDEPNYWYAIFERFRLQGPKRSLLSIYNADRAERGMEPTTAPPGTWTTNRKAWEWDKRAEAWDAYRREEERKRRSERELQEYIESKRKAQQAMKTTIQALQAMLGKVIMTQSESDLAPKDLRDISLAAATIFKEVRLTFGDPTEITDVQTKGRSLVPSLDDRVRQMQQERDLQKIEAFRQELMPGDDG